MSILAYYLPFDGIAVENADCRSASPAPPSWEEELLALARQLRGRLSLPPSPEALRQAILDFALQIKAQAALRFEECFLHIGSHGLEFYLVAATPEYDSLNGRSTLLSPPSPPFVIHSNQEAVAQFFRSALGWLPNHTPAAAPVETFRRAYALASEQGLTGVTLQRLFQRGLWLYEKVRLETDFFRHAAAIEDVLSEVAGKIFGGLKERTALVAGSATALAPVVKALQQADIGRLYFALPGAEKSADLPADQRIVSLQEIARLPAIDLLIWLDHPERPLLTRAYLQKLMSARHNAPLLLADLTAQETRPEGIEKMYNLFFFRRQDLEGMVEQNAAARQQLETEVTAWIGEEVKQFYQWLTSTERFHFGSMVGRSRQMQQVFELIARIAQTDITVLIEGESGTGKELVARAIHQASARAQRPFIAVNCGALPENLLESELFGHARGAFTGAVNHKRGLIEEVNGGTIFLDEIGEMSPALQVKLLRFLQDGEIKRVGSNAVLQLNVRVLAATNRHLQMLVQEGKFRSDLYYRLNVIGIQLPSLRERPEDIEILAWHFLRKFAARMRKPMAAFSPAALQCLRRYAWPGNVRELENVMERAVALTGSDTLEVIDLPAPLRAAPNATPAAPRLPLKDIERQYILDTVAACNGNYDEAARVLGIGRTTLWRKLKSYSSEEGENDEKE
ncbi:MAG: Anaerobic nitric oxide reductase transcription regulator NorR [bacterium]|nr:Anaerobic nitric oxide reductase transcription regulator NorR [bacterium]